MHHLRVALSSDRVGSKVPGGIGRYASELARALARRLDSAPEEICLPGHGFAGSGGPALRQFLRVPPIRTACDVVHATSLAIPPTSNPLVVTVHDLIFEKWPQAYTRWGIAFHRRGLQIASEKARVVIAPTEAVADELAERYPQFSGRVVAIHHGVPSFCSRIPGPGGSPDGSLGRPGQDAAPAGTATTFTPPPHPFFLWVGTIEPRKNLSRLVQAFSLLGRSRADVGLVLAGKLGWKIRREALLAGVAKSRVGERVIFVADPDDATLRILYERGLALVFPSIDEGFGFPVLEAMASGLPVIASDIPPIREVVGRAAILVDPRRVRDLAEAMDAVLEDPGLAERLRKSGSERAARFGWDESARAHIDAYARAIER